MNTVTTPEVATDEEGRAAGFQALDRCNFTVISNERPEQADFHPVLRVIRGGRA